MKPLRPLLILILLLLPAAAAEAQTEESAEALLRKVGETYRSLESFHFDAAEQSITHSKGYDRRTETKVVTARDDSGRSRVEFDDRVSGGVAVTDGLTTWVYLPRLGKYTQVTGMPLRGVPGLPGDAKGPDFAKVAERYPARYRDVGERIIGANIVRRETIEVGGEQIECSVVEAEYHPPPGTGDSKILRMFWVDPWRSLIVRERAQASTKPQNLSEPVVVTQKILFRVAKADEPLGEGLFVFRPPQGAQQVESFDRSGDAPASWIGQPALDFTLTGLDGQTVQLADLQGKVVLLDFWASWCGPCRIDMPRIEALHQDFQEKDLVVLGINGESPDAARAYLDEHGYSFPTLVDHGMKVAQSYGVNAIPTVVVIGRDGKIASYLQGSHPESRLRAAVAGAGAGAGVK